MDLSVEGNGHHPIIRPQTADKRVCCLANLRELRLSRAAHIQHQSDRKRSFYRSEICNALLDSILKNVKVFLAQVGNVSSVVVHYDSRHRDQTRADAHDTVFLDST